MGLIKRFGLFLILNLLVILSVSLILYVFNVQPFLQARGIDYYSLMIFCLVWGMVGSIISLMLSKTMARLLIGIKMLDTSHPITQRVYRLAQIAGLKKMPEVGIFEASNINAFATGPSRNNSLVAVSTGLVDQLNENELDGVLAHEISHIMNGDMVTMSLLQGLINAFVMFLARVFAFFMTSATRSRGSRRSSPFVFFMWVMLFQTIFMMLGYVVLAYFSRKREYKADAGGASIAGSNNMIAALQKLQTTMETKDNPKLESVKMLQISARPKRFAAIFSTHPPLEKRIEALKNLQENIGADHGLSF